MGEKEADRAVKSMQSAALPMANLRPPETPATMTERPKNIRTALAAMALVLGIAAVSNADDTPPRIWLVSTRNAPHCGDLDTTLQSLCYWQWTDGCQWSSADAEAFFATDDPAEPTVLFIHGNQTNSCEAVEKGWYVYRFIRANAHDRPFRYVIWSWPTDRAVRSQLNDARLKLAYTEAECHYLAQWLGRFRPGVQVSLVGHSFGPRIITGALHLLGGGQVAGQSLSDPTVAAWKHGQRNPIRAVLLAAATDPDGLAPGGEHDRAIPLIDQMLVTCNHCDRVLRRYPKLCDGPQAMGVVGPCGIDDTNIQAIAVSATVGKTHDWRYYCTAIDTCGLWPRYTFLDDP